MKNLSVRIHDDQARELGELSAELGCTKTALVLDGLDLAIDKAKKKAALLRERFGTARVVEHGR